MARTKPDLMETVTGWIAVFWGGANVMYWSVSAFAQMGPAPDSLSRGFFSASQVERGRESFMSECTDCHEIEEFTGVGAYLESQEGERLWDVFEFIWSEMPEDRPAWLEPTEYADILAYILSVYGFPAGDTDMPIDRASLREVRVTMPQRPGS
jgi:mono/diheme cytochrome c family protein